jgi:hypothetical protein
MEINSSVDPDQQLLNIIELEAAPAIAVSAAIKLFEKTGQNIYDFYIAIDHAEDGDLRITISAKSRRTTRTLGATSADELRSHAYYADKHTGIIKREVGVR